MNIQKKIGIWGLGVVGKSYIQHFLSIKNSNINLCVLDARTPNTQDQQLLNDHTITFYPQEQVLNFLDSCDIIYKSPGIDAHAYQKYHHKIHHELDIFAEQWHKPIIAVTGTLGKTSIVNMLNAVLTTVGKKIALGGNIGQAMLALLPHQEQYDYALLELSSYQLEHIKNFAPDLAIITNIFPKHLDRHGTIENYIQAKLAITNNQHDNQCFLAPSTVHEQINNCSRAKKYSLSTSYNNNSDIAHQYYLDNQGNLVKTGVNNLEVVVVPHELWPLYSYPDNWHLVAAALDILVPGFNPAILKKAPNTIPEHRGEKVATINAIDFYNDSKSTIMQATIASVKRLQHKHIHLIIGGISDGENRSELFKMLNGHSITYYTFGKEADYLAQASTAYAKAYSHSTLESAVKMAYAQAKPGECVLLSPAGPSYDLYNNYIERGNHFFTLVKNLLN